MLRYKLTPYERAFTFQILSQDKVIEDAIASAGGSFLTSNGWKIQVKNSPELKVVSKRIFLRGAKSSRDMRIDRTWNIVDNYKRDAIINDVDQALAELISFAKRYDDRRYTSPGYIHNVFVGCGNPDFYGIPSCWYWAPEVQIQKKYAPYRTIDKDGWGTNKPSGNPMVYAL